MRVIQAILIIAAAIAATHAAASSPSIPATPYALAINGPEAHLLVAGFPSPAALKTSPGVLCPLHVAPCAPPFVLVDPE